MAPLSAPLWSPTKLPEAPRDARETPPSIRDVLPCTALEGGVFLSVRRYGRRDTRAGQRRFRGAGRVHSFGAYCRADYHAGNTDALNFARAFHALPAANRERVSELLHDLWPRTSTYQVRV
jgi:hypothetical protein